MNITQDSTSPTTNSLVNGAIMTSEVRLVAGVKLAVPELFADPGFQAYVNNSPVMTWHDKKGPIEPDDWADVVVFVDPSLGGDGSDSGMPYWDIIVDKVKAALGGYNPRMRESYVVVLTNI